MYAMQRQSNRVIKDLTTDGQLDMLRDLRGVPAAPDVNGDLDQ